MIADFYISDEILDESGKKGFDKSLIKGNDLIKTMNMTKLRIMILFNVK